MIGNEEVCSLHKNSQRNTQSVRAHTGRLHRSTNTIHEQTNDHHALHNATCAIGVRQGPATLYIKQLHLPFLSTQKRGFSASRTACVCTRTNDPFRHQCTTTRTTHQLTVIIMNLHISTHVDTYMRIVTICKGTCQTSVYNYVAMSS